MRKQHSKQIVIIGQERAGKTFWTEHFCNNYAKSKGAVCVYNVGMPSDYSNFLPFDLMDFNDHEDWIKYHSGKDAAKKYSRRPSIFLFKYKGKVYHYKDFSTLFYKKVTKTKSLYSQEDSALWMAFHHYFTRTLIVCDDSKVIFTDGLKKGHFMTLNRKNHCGEKNPNYQRLGACGVDVVLMFHNADEVNKYIWNYTTDVILLNTVSKPSLVELKAADQRQAVWKCWHDLKKSPEYTAFHIPLKGENYLNISESTIKI